MISTEQPSLREMKRRQTLEAIEDHATSLVLERGFDDVTVDDICAGAGISKRTFFNYVESKEVAVVGPGPRVPT
ncbi:MAG: TetR family transcriptional regulator, partial [Corynebacterium sp.]|nr:TetR family transcriptional regulator [Corynebacterium sp.]